MTEQEIAITIAEYLVGNWVTVLTSLGAAIVTTASLTWFVFNAIHKKEVAILKQRVEVHEDNFNQFSRIMEQRLAIAESTAEQLKEKLTQKSAIKSKRVTPNHNEKVFYQSSSSSYNQSKENQNEEDSVDETPVFARGSKKTEIGDFIERVSSLSSMLKVINQLI